MKTQTWEEANAWERDWHGDCINSYNEETKQYVYAKLMGLGQYATNFYGQRGWNFGDKKILDMGCGPYSILLKSQAVLKVGVDPCPYPDWVKARYEAANVKFMNAKGEDALPENGVVFDEVLLYNCLQHTEAPEKICKNILGLSKIVRVFEWVNTGLAEGHIHDLTAEKLNNWLEGNGKVSYINDGGPMVGEYYVGIFKGKHYDGE